jgi:hypothetical protein
MGTEIKEVIIKKFELISDKYHKLSLLFHELSQSLKIQSKNMHFREFKELLKDLNLDINKLVRITNSIRDIELNDLR